MLLSMNWIGDYVDLSGLDKKALIGRFTLSCAEVEDIYDKGADTWGVVVARVAEMENHPSSKKLHLLKLDVGEESLIDCVCGAPNVRVGMTVAFARAGGSVAGHAIGDAVVGGYPSHGMCCSGAELGISADNSGLLELPETFPIGQDLKTLLPIDDVVFEVDNKSLTNRPDLWGHYGIAREFATLAERPLKAPALFDTATVAHLPALSIEISEPSLCYRYCGITADGITRRESPLEMQIRLFYCGSRAINFQADLTNYVMMELGQPMHAFDHRRVDSIRVRRFAEPFSFETLDGVARRIDDQTLMICTGQDKPVAVAGIMGGLESEIEDDTTSLLLESACFDAVSVRKSSTRLGLRTDASMRYEKTLDPEMAKTAAERLLYLLCAHDEGTTVTSSLTDVYPTKYPVITLFIDKAYVDRYTGIDISEDRIEQTLTALGFGVKREKGGFTVTVPSFRSTKDVTIKADLIEEITRIYGYDNFAIKTAASPLFPVRAEQVKTDTDAIKDLLVLREKLHEVHSYLWADLARNKALGIDTPDNVRLLNAQTPDHAILRRSMIPTLLSFAEENRGYANRYGIFEIGHVILGTKEDGTADEHRQLGVVLYDRTATEEATFLRARDILTRILSQLRHKTPTFARVAEVESFSHPANTFSVLCDGAVIGSLGVLHPTVAEAIDKKAAVAYLTLDMEAFSALSENKLLYTAPSKYPGIDIDLAFTVSLGELDYTAAEAAFRRVGGELLRSVSMVDTYESEGVESLTLRFAFSSPERTLSKAELTDATDAIIKAAEEFGMIFKAL